MKELIEDMQRFIKKCEHKNEDFAALYKGDGYIITYEQAKEIIKALELMENDKPYSLIDILQILADAANVLLHEKDYDRNGYEEIELCVKQARKLINQNQQ